MTGVDPAVARRAAVLFCAQFCAPLAIAQPEVTFIEPRTASVNEQLSLTGTVTTPLDATLSSQLAGLVQSVAVDAGDTVESGQAILRLDARLAELALQSADAALREGRTREVEARRLRDEAEPLAREGNFSRSGFATRQAEAELAAAAVERLEAQRAEQAERVARHVLRAPFDGVIRSRRVAPGEWVAAGAPVLELVSHEGLRIDVRVPQQRFADLSGQARATVEFEAWPGRTFTGRVVARVPAMDELARSFLVRVALDDRKAPVAPGMSARVRLALSGGQSALEIPAGAVVRFPDGSAMAWIVDGDGHVRRQPLTLGKERDGMIEVHDGLAAADRVVVNGIGALRPGLAVQARRHGSP